MIELLMGCPKSFWILPGKRAYLWKLCFIA